MRPHRVRLTHSLVENYNLSRRMLVHRPEPRSREQIENFHCDGTPASCHNMKSDLLHIEYAHPRYPNNKRLLQQERPSDVHSLHFAPS